MTSRALIAVTGGAGFIGANLAAALHRRGCDVLLVDDFAGGGEEKLRNTADLNIAQRMDKLEFLEAARAGRLPRKLSAVLHQGACADTMETDEKYMMENNLDYSKTLFEFCAKRGAQFIYASSASVYGGGDVFTESPECESALNIYAKSKLLFDNFVRGERPQFQCVGLRYFNVYGPREDHKGRMASVARHFLLQYMKDGGVRLFEGGGGYADGEQRRDFISVEDVVAINMFFLDNPSIGGIYNAGCGRSESFNAVALAAINACRRRDGREPATLERAREEGEISYIPMPAALRGKYQNYTEADLTKLRAAGYGEKFLRIEEGVDRYAGHLLDAPARA